MVHVAERAVKHGGARELLDEAAAVLEGVPQAAGLDGRIYARLIRARIDDTRRAMEG